MAKIIVLVLLSTWVLPTTLSEQGQTKLALSHALVPEAQIIRLRNQVTHTTYIDLAPIMEYLEKLKINADSILTHLEDDIAHLKNSGFYSMKEEGIYYTFFPHEENMTGSRNAGCFLIGGQSIKPSNKEGWKKLGTLVQKFNEENKEVADIPKPTKIVVPVKTEDKSSKLKYVGIGPRATPYLELDDSIATVENLAKAATAFPLFNIETNEFEFRTENELEYVVCELVGNSKITSKTAWQTEARRRKAKVEKIIHKIQDSKETFENYFDGQLPFTYSLGNKVRMENLGSLLDLDTMKTDMASHSAANIQDSGRFALANMFIDNYLSTLSTKLNEFLDLFSSKEGVYRKILKAAIEPMLHVVSTNLKSIANKKPFLSAFKRSVKNAAMKYDSSSKVFLQEFNYVPPKSEDLGTLYKILTFPIISESYEVLLHAPETHLISDDGGEKFCEFIEINFLLSHCVRLPDLENTYSCRASHLEKIDNCCKLMIQPNTIQALETCGSTPYEVKPSLSLINYDSHSAVFATSALQEREFETICSGRPPTTNTANETMLISTDCQVKFDEYTIQPVQQSRSSTILTPLRTLFQSDFNHLKGQTIEPMIPEEYSKETDKSFHEKESFLLELLKLEPIQWTLFVGTLILSLIGFGGMSTCVIVALRKRREQQKRPKEQEAHVMENIVPRRHTMPIFQQPPATPFQFI